MLRASDCAASTACGLSSSVSRNIRLNLTLIPGPHNVLIPEQYAALQADTEGGKSGREQGDSKDSFLSRYNASKRSAPSERTRRQTPGSSASLQR